MHCFDTDLAVAFLRGESAAVNKVKQFDSLSVDVAITTLTLCELYRGAFLSHDPEKNAALANALLERVTLLSQNRLSCLVYGQDYAALKKKGLMTQQMDLLIASVCKANNCVLVTRNIKDFNNIPNLLLEKW